MTIVETVVAIVILGVSAVGLAGMALTAGRTASATELIASRETALSNLSELVVATPFADLNEIAGCDDGGDQDFKYWYCIRVHSERTDLREVTVMVWPDYENAVADSVVVLRGRGTSTSPF
jgi:type II secretory pathway pseudopilin PulG